MMSGCMEVLPALGSFLASVCTKYYGDFELIMNIYFRYYNIGSSLLSEKGQGEVVQHRSLVL